MHVTVIHYNVCVTVVTLNKVSSLKMPSCISICIGGGGATILFF